jgi:hypothetical protein
MKTYKCFCAILEHTWVKKLLEQNLYADKSKKYFSISATLTGFEITKESEVK